MTDRKSFKPLNEPWPSDRDRSDALRTCQVTLLSISYIW
jgi:hypothetical protein